MFDWAPSGVARVRRTMQCTPTGKKANGRQASTVNRQYAPRLHVVPTMCTITTWPIRSQLFALARMPDQLVLRFCAVMFLQSVPTSFVGVASVASAIGNKSTTRSPPYSFAATGNLPLRTRAHA